MNIIASIALWVFGAILTVILYFVVLFFSVILPFDKQRKVAHAQCFWWSDFLTRMNPYWRLKVKGLENIDHNKTYVIISNHQSMADIIVLYQTRMQFKWVAKESLFRIPFVGWCLRLTKHISLARGEYSSIKKIYQEAAGWLRNNMSVLFFPEGTRSDTGEMKPFQNGAFKLAVREKKPILPIRLEGNYEAIPKGSWIFKAKVHANLTVLPAIDTSSFGPGDFEKLKNMVFDKIANAGGN